MKAVVHPTERRLRELYDLAHFECVRADIAKRLTASCGNLSRPEFQMLMDRMARVQIRGENLA
jgi:hypothetical protein